ncbi:MAG: TonB-dependent copper receptor [Gallionellaceae bacterium]|nr:TonB-dependent copper receptor [Gallionellaceae bacterium]
MHGNFALRTSTLLILAAIAGMSWAGDVTTLDEVVVTAPRMAEPLTIELDPKLPQQPVPANDGASFLKNVPGFAMIRKGGTDGDPVLRGLAGSRLNILLDGTEFYGGCGMRMDPPTAYVFPETFDKVTVIKGPETVLYGNGNSAGVVLFDRDAKAMSQPGGRVDASLMAGAWGRLDGVLAGNYAGEKAYIHAVASHAESNDYKDGDGKKVHSFYERENLSGAAGWTPDRDTRLEFSAVASRAEAAYADRTMDGVKFDREGYGIKFEKGNLSPVVQKIAAQLNYNYIDHVMDNYSLRTYTAMSHMVNNPDRETKSAKLSADLAVAATTLLTVGADWQGNEHTLRKVSGTEAQADAYAGLPRIKDMATDITGLFGELRHDLSERQRVIAGLRVDDWSADRYNSMTGGTFMAGADETLTSGFVRYEQDLAGQSATAFVGLGHSERPMDYWEASTYNGLLASGRLNPERNDQLDAGLIWKGGDFNGSVSLFYSRIDDYILTYAGSTVPSARVMNCPATATMGVYSCSGNIDATRYGGEADMAWRFAPQWTLRGTLAWVHADNDTDNVPLAQTPPLEGRLGLDYTTGPWTFGGVVRMVAEQDRVDVGYGNIVGQDYGKTSGFNTLALNLAYKPNKQWLVSAGLDNVFDKSYAEHLARDNSFEAGPGTRVNEPGRFIWAKLNYRFD